MIGMSPVRLIDDFPGSAASGVKRQRKQLPVLLAIHLVS
jgi:hypothetical protein